MGQGTFQRFEIKFLLNKEQKEAVLEAMKPYMKADSYGESTIRNIYFDRPDFLLIRHSLDKPIYKCTLSEYLSQSRFKMRLQRRERDRTGKAEITRDRANLTETILRVCDSNNEKNGQNFISVFEVMKNKRIIG